MGAFSALKCSNGTTFLVTSNVGLCNLGSTFFTSNFFVAIEGRHLSDERLKEYSAIEVATEPT